MVAKNAALSRFFGGRKPVARYNLGPDNKSLDASGISGLLIDNLSVTQLSPAASTQTLCSYF
jgi:hypothetical protein